MTIEDFDKTIFMCGMQARYRNVPYDICSVNFDEKLLGLAAAAATEHEDINWVRCENAEIIK